MFEFITKMYEAGILEVVLYWIPMVLCGGGYSVATIRDFKYDRASRENGSGYYPRLRIRTILARITASVIPVWNLFVVMFDIGPDMCSKLYGWVHSILDAPLVPPHKR